MNSPARVKSIYSEYIDKIVFSEEDIRKKVEELGEEITRDFTGKDLIVVCVLKGSLYFTADLIRQIKIPLSLDFVAIESYGDSTKTSGAARITKDLDEDVEGRHVLIVEDIMDTGLTLDYLVKVLRLRKPADIKICALLNKTSRRIINSIKVDYSGFEVQKMFAVGYGLDFKNKFRHLPFICTFREDNLPVE